LELLSKRKTYSEEMLLEDILNNIDCQPGGRNKMTGTELVDGIFGMVMRMNSSLETVLRPQKQRL